MCLNISNAPESVSPIDFSGNMISSNASKEITKGIQKQMLSRVCNDFKCQALVNPGKGQSCYWNDDPDNTVQSDNSHRRLNSHGFFVNTSTELDFRVPSQKTNRLTGRNTFYAKARSLVQSNAPSKHNVISPSTLLVILMAVPSFIYGCFRLLRSLKNRNRLKPMNPSSRQQPTPSNHLTHKLPTTKFEQTPANPQNTATLTMNH